MHCLTFAPSMNKKFSSWFLFIILCIIWGSSFILMKWGMYGTGRKIILSPYHVAALRMFSAGLVMLPFLIKSFKELPPKTFWYVLGSGWLGSFFPAFLFCLAETKIDGALTGSLNSLTPLFVVVTGALFFGLKTGKRKIFGVLIGLAGSGLLLLATISHSPGNLAYTGFIILATIFYGINVNLIHSKLIGVRSIHIAAISLTALIPPSLLVLIFTGYFKLPLGEPAYVISTSASCILGVAGTVLASILFYMLVKQAGGLFASLVTYGIPFIAIGWGIYYGEKFSFLQLLALLIILAGVYLANMPEKKTGVTSVPPAIDLPEIVV